MGASGTKWHGTGGSNAQTVDWADAAAPSSLDASAGCGRDAGACGDGSDAPGNEIDAGADAMPVDDSDAQDGDFANRADSGSSRQGDQNTPADGSPFGRDSGTMRDVRSGDRER